MQQQTPRCKNELTTELAQQIHSRDTIHRHYGSFQSLHMLFSNFPFVHCFCRYISWGTIPGQQDSDIQERWLSSRLKRT